MPPPIGDEYSTCWPGQQLSAGRQRGSGWVNCSVLFHHQVSTCTENVKFREVTVDLLPGTSSGK